MQRLVTKINRLSFDISHAAFHCLFQGTSPPMTKDLFLAGVYIDWCILISYYLQNGLPVKSSKWKYIKYKRFHIL